MKHDKLLLVIEAVAGCLRELGADSVQQQLIEKEQFAAFYARVVMRLPWEAGVRATALPVCVALALISQVRGSVENSPAARLWPSLPRSSCAWSEMLLRTRLRGLIADISRLARKHPVKGANLLDGIFQIVVAYLNGWKRSICWGSVGWDGIPPSAAALLRNYLLLSVDIGLNWFKDKDEENLSKLGYKAAKMLAASGTERRELELKYRQHQAFQADKSYHPRVEGFPESLASDFLAQVIYHRLIAQLDEAKCRCWESAEKKDEKRRTCERQHSLGAWNPKEMGLPEFLQRAVKGSFGGLKPAGLDMGMLVGCLRIELPLRIVWVAVWFCPCSPEEGLYLDHCPHCGRAFSASVGKLDADRRWVLVGEHGPFFAKASWRCLRCGNHFAVRSFLPNGKPDRHAADSCPRKECGVSQTGKWTTLYFYKQPSSPGPISGVDQRIPPADPEIGLPLGDRLKNAWYDMIKSLALPDWASALTGLAWKHFYQHPDSVELGWLLSKSPALNRAALECFNPLIPAPIRISADFFTSQWPEYREQVAEVIRTVLSPLRASDDGPPTEDQDEET